MLFIGLSGQRPARKPRRPVDRMTSQEMNAAGFTRMSGGPAPHLAMLRDIEKPRNHADRSTREKQKSRPQEWREVPGRVRLWLGREGQPREHQETADRCYGAKYH